MLLTTHLCPWLREPLAELELAVSRGRLGHGWILAGPAGIGKLNLAMAFADRLLRGRSGSEPLPELGPHELLAAMQERAEPRDRHPDLHVAWPEEGKTTISVDQIRVVTEAVALTAFQGKSKVIVIEPAEAMTTAAANALLKSLEEPTPDTFLLLVSHRPGRLPKTVRSRCQSLVIRRPGATSMRGWLGQANAEAAATALAEGWSPRVAARSLVESQFNKYNDLLNDLNLIYDSRTDAQTVLDKWSDIDSDTALGWIADRLRALIRRRLGASGTNSVTEQGEGLPDNAWQGIPTGRLFDLLDEAESLRDRLGTGINEPLAMQVLLNGFLPRGAARTRTRRADT